MSYEDTDDTSADLEEMSLDELREEIADIDREIVELIARRIYVADAITKVKAERHLPTTDEAQEERVMERAGNYAEQFDVDANSVKAIFRLLIELNKAEQRENRFDTDSLFESDAESEHTPPESPPAPETIRDKLKPTPHTLYEMPKRDEDAYFYYFTDSTYTQQESKYRILDDSLTLLGRHRGGIQVTIIDRDRIRDSLWRTLTDGLEIEQYPALVVAEGDLGVGDVDISTDEFVPNEQDYATLEDGVIADSILEDADATHNFLNELYDAAYEDRIQSTMRKEKLIEVLSIGKSEIDNLLSIIGTS